MRKSESENPKTETPTEIRIRKSGEHKGEEQDLPGEAAPPADAAPASRRRLWLKRFLAMILVPLVVLGSLELALRLAGYGYPTDFFLRTRIGGQDFYTANVKFGFRFFPPALARAPMALRMPVVKPANTYRIFLLGESAAIGDPDPSYGVGRYLEVLLRDRYPGTRFEVDCVAVTAINSHAILPIARECARHDGDLWIIYMGNNEVIGPFGAGTVYGPKAPGLGFIRANLAVKTTKIGQLLDAMFRGLRNDPALKTWGGMKTFMNNRLRYDDPIRQRILDHLRDNLDDILRAGVNSRTPIILSTMAVNLKDCGPFASMHRSTLDAAQESAWQGAYEQGVALEASGLYQQALVPYSKAAEIDPQFADLQFRIGHCQLALTNFAEARHDFELARDYDALAIRADTRINQIIKDAAARYERGGVHLVDGAETVARNSPGGIPGNELFFEHVHLNFAGNYLLARTFADPVAKLLPASITAKDSGSWDSAELCDRRLALTIWDRYRIWETIRSRIGDAPFTGESDHTTLAKMHDAELDEIRAREKSETPAQAQEMYRQALALSPEDHLLHANFAQFLVAGGDLPGAIREAQRVRDLRPQLSGTHCFLGTLLARAGKASQAADCFSRALAIQGDSVEALNGLGLIRVDQHKVSEAAALFKRALRVKPQFVATYLNLGFLEHSEGKVTEAMAHYREAARLQPQGPADYFYRAMIAACAAQQDEVIEYLSTLIPYQPDFWQARELLGYALLLRGRDAEAQAQFAEVIRYRPGFASAHVNLGLTLARQRKTEQALSEFRTALQLDPGNKLAQKQIQQIQDLKNRAPAPSGIPLR
jgi:tetratricopeptide (TPR) repeat protein